MECDVRVAVQSPRRLTREALADCLHATPGFVVVGHTASAAELMPLADLRRPDVVLVDLRESSGRRSVDFEPLRTFHAQFPDVGVVGLYENCTPPTVRAARRSGVGAVLHVGRGLDALQLALRRHASLRSSPQPPSDRLTDLELDVMWLMGAGHSVAEMAELLEVRPATVEQRKRSVYAKLDAHSQGAALARTFSLGFGCRSDSAAGRMPSTGRWEGDRRRPTVVLVRGPTGPVTELVVGTLLSRDVAFVQDRDGRYDPREYPLRSCLGPVVAVLVAPLTSADWLECGALGVPVIVVPAERPAQEAVVESLRRGAAAVIAPPDVPIHLPAVLAAVACGYMVFRPTDVASAVHLAAGPSGLPELTAREADILRSVGRGESVRQTARALGIAAKTVENTQARLFRKLGVRNRSAALAVAHRLGLLAESVAP